jgi:hypothetical protein
MVFLIDVVIALVIAGLVIWVINQPWVPIDATFKQIIKVVVVVAVVIWLLFVLVAALGGGSPFVLPRR